MTSNTLLKERSNWLLDEGKFLTSNEVRKLVRITEEAKDIPTKDRRYTPVKDWFVVILATQTGLRVQEMTDLNCGDLQVFDGRSSVFVRKGKNGKPRVVLVGSNFRKATTLYLQWKQANNEPVGDDDPVFIAHGKRISKRSIQRAYERSIRRAGITQRKGVGIHSLRHTYASFLLKACNYNLRFVQQQLGHSSVRTTEIYTHLFNQDCREAMERLYQ